MTDYSDLEQEYTAAAYEVYRGNARRDADPFEPTNLDAGKRMMRLNGELARAIVSAARERGGSGPMRMKGHTCGSCWRPELTRTCKGCLSRKITLIPLNAWAKWQDAQTTAHRKEAA